MTATSAKATQPARPWKEPRKKRASSIVTMKSLRPAWKKKEEQRRKMAELKAYQRQLEADARREREEAKERREERKRQREENERRAEVFQRITNTAKLRKLSKKQWRSIEKR